MFISYWEIARRLIEVQDLPLGALEHVDYSKPTGFPVICDECKGSGNYIGLNKTEPCKKCNGSGTF